MVSGNGSTRLSVFILLCASILPLFVWAEKEPVNDIQLMVTPDRCIALNQGQKCYQKLKFSWLVNDARAYCLTYEKAEKPLICWNGAEVNSHRTDFQYDRDRVYWLIEKESSEVLAEVTVTVAWVYKLKRRRAKDWRVF